MTDLPTYSKAKYAISKGSMIGEGAFRQVFRTGKAKWVYKIDSQNESGPGTNSSEMENYTKLRTVLVGSVRIPEMHLVGKNIIAAEYVTGSFPAYCTEYYGCKCDDSELFSGRCWLDVVKFAVDGMLIDIHAGNVLIAKDGTIYIIDLGV